MRTRLRRESGMITVELAAALPVLALLMLAGLSAVRVVDARERCLDAAREVARAAARGDDAAVARAGAVAPGGARISIARGADEVTATVSLVVHPLGATCRRSRCVSARWQRRSRRWRETSVEARRETR